MSSLVAIMVSVPRGSSTIDSIRCRLEGGSSVGSGEAPLLRLDTLAKIARSGRMESVGSRVGTGIGRG